MKKPSFLALPRPVVACIMGERTIEEDIAVIRNAEYEGASAFAVHLEPIKTDQLTEENFRRLAQATRRPVMTLHYRGGGALRFSDAERAQVLKTAIRCGAAATDITADMFDASPLEFSARPEAIDQQRRLIDEIHEMGGEVVMSSHIAQARTCEQVTEQMAAIERRGADYAKIVTAADTQEQFLEAIRTTLALRGALHIPFIHLCTGRFARLQRCIGPSLGCALTFCVQKYTAAYTTEQVPVKQMLRMLDSLQWHIDDYLEE